MSRCDDIRAQLQAANDALAAIEEEYKVSLGARQIEPRLKIKVKNYLENLRSVLDYLGSEIHERYCAKEAKAYFPTSCKDSEAFRLHIHRCFPGLEGEQKNVFDKLESYQPYAPDAPQCLPLFATLVNENKHDRLSPQTRTVQRGLELDFSGGGGITLGPGATMSGTGKIVSDGGVLELRGNVISGDSPAQGLPDTIRQTVIVWVGFRFDAIDREALSFLKEILGVVEGIANDLARDLWP